MTQGKKGSKPELPTRLRNLQVDLPRNDLCVAFANTAEPRQEKRPRSSRPALGVISRPFGGYDDLLDWMVRMGGLSPAEFRELRALADQQSLDADAAFERVIELRGALVRMAGGLARRTRPARGDFEFVAAALGDLPRLELVAAEYDFTWAWARAELTLEWPRYRLACSMASLLSSEARAYVRQCAAKDCTILFVDNTRNHLRRWCDMDPCGNLVKVRRYRKRFRT